MEDFRHKLLFQTIEWLLNLNIYLSVADVHIS